MTQLQTNSGALNAEFSDVDVIERVLAGDVNCFELLVRRYNERLYRIGIGHLKEHSLVEDTMQRCYIKVFQNLSSFKQESSVSTWVIRIMINECLMVLRKKNRKNFITTVSMDEIEHEPAHMLNAESALIEQEMKITLEKVILELPEPLRLVYIMREVEQLSTDECASCLEISRENIKVRFSRSKKMIRHRLMELAGGTDLFGYDRRYCDPLTANVMKKIKNLE